jgi:hypothetical protein
MSTILLCYYCIGWAFVAITCRDFYNDELNLGMLIALIALWPLAVLLMLQCWVPALFSTVVWRRE